MPLKKDLPCPKCNQPLIVTYDKQDKINKCDCIVCGWQGLKKHLADQYKQNTL